MKIFSLMHARFSARVLAVFLLVGIMAPVIVLHAQSESSAITELGMELRLLPSRVVVTPASVTVEEGSGNVQFTAMAYYEYGDPLVEAQPPIDLSGDPNVLWVSTSPSVALVQSTTGLVTPDSDLNQGSAGSYIRALYPNTCDPSDPSQEYCWGSGLITVTGEVVSPPGGSLGGGGAGGGTGGTGGDSGTGTDTGAETDTGTGTDTGTDTGTETDTGTGTDTGTDTGTETDTGTGADTGTDTGTETDTGTGTDTGTETDTGTGADTDTDTGTSDTGTQPGTGTDTGTVTETGTGGIQLPEDYLPEENQFISDESYLPLDFPISERQVRPLSEVFAPHELTLKEGEIGITRAAIVARIAEKMNFLQMRSDLLDKCYADLENCTAVFRMFSLYNGIKLDPDNLVLFPDTAGLPEEDVINKMALLGIIQGYYGIEQSPFLPQKPILRIEALKVMVTILDSLQKAQPNYEQSDFAFSTLFYREVYAASLLATMERQRTAYQPMLWPRTFLPGLRLAHALTEEAWQLIKEQKTPFTDIRPDINDRHWYYPIVVSKICAPGLFQCAEGAQLEPDKSPAPEQVDQYISVFNNFIAANNLDQDVTSDHDEDGILNIDENSVYLTNPLLPDTDEDELNDGAEVKVHRTNPILRDTDEDGLSDGVEVNEHKTDPVLYDTDGDGFSDGVEIAEGSDPLRPESVPADKNANRISDVWEIKYNIIVLDGSQDSDGDGISDLLEYQYGTNPTRIDSDMDGFTDAEEILELKTNPNDVADPGDPENLPVLINNFQYGQVVADASPLIRGVGPASLGNNQVKIQILLRNEFGAEVILGETLTDARGRFVMIPDIAIKNGTYFLLARSINKGQVKTSLPVKIVIDNTLDVVAAKPERLEDVPITEEVLLKNLVLAVDSVDGRPVLYGTLSEFGSRVNVTWQSLVVSSALIADTTDGSFSMKAPKLEPGKHVVYVQSVRKKDNAVGKTLKIEFELKMIGAPKSSAPGPEMQGALGSVAAGVAKFVSEQSWPFWIGIVVVVVLAAGGGYLYFGGKRVKDEEDENKSDKT